VFWEVEDMVKFSEQTNSRNSQIYIIYLKNSLMQPLCMLQYLIGRHVSGKNAHPQVLVIQHVLW
jgi:hypothetical protein